MEGDGFLHLIELVELAFEFREPRLDAMAALPVGKRVDEVRDAPFECRPGLAGGRRQPRWR